MNGKPGDDPVHDIIWYRKAVFGPKIDLLVAELAGLGGADLLQGELSDHLERKAEGQPARPVAEIEATLRPLRDRLERERRAAGWEVDRILAEARDLARELT